MRHLYLFCFILLLACGSTEKSNNPYANMPTRQLRAYLDTVNRSISKIQEMEMMAWQHRKGYKMIESGTGLRYQIYHRGNGDSASCDQVAHVRYALRLLDGKECYNNKKTGDVMAFVICMDFVETGLHEGVRYMREGDKIRMVMPSVLAHGLLGDRNCIPPHSPIVLDLELVKLSR